MFKLAVVEIRWTDAVDDEHFEPSDDLRGAPCATAAWMRRLQNQASSAGGALAA